jgi:hypothetical protein
MIEAGEGEMLAFAKIGSGSEELLRLADRLGAPYGIERSLKLVPGAVLRDRILVSLHKSAFGPDPAKRILDLAAELGIPPKFREVLLDDLPAADFIHLGHEGDERRSLVKIYLEFATRLRVKRPAVRQDGTALLVHRAVKWDQLMPSRAVVANYHAFPALRRAAVAARIRELFGGGRCAPVHAAVSLYDRACGRTAASDLLFMEVAEENTPRRSFDLNLYDAGLAVMDAAPFAEALARYFELSETYLPLSTADFSRERLGHISGGLARDGRGFLTLYYGSRGR